LLLGEPDGILRAFWADTGELAYVLDLNGNQISASHTAGRLASLTYYPAGKSTDPTYVPTHVMQIAYNAAGRIESVTDPVGRQTLFGYDASGEHLISARQHDGRIETYAYVAGADAGKEHALVEVAFAGSMRRHFEYDNWGRLLRMGADGDEEVFALSYDSTGRVIVTDAFGASNQIFLDHNEIVAKLVDDLGRSLNLLYDDQGRVTQVTDDQGRTTLYAYDRDGTVRVTDPEGGRNDTKYATFQMLSPIGNTVYGQYKRLQSVRDPNGNLTTFGYSTQAAPSGGAGQATSATYADGTIATWIYDDVGNTTQWTNRRGQTVELTYDTEGQLTSRMYPDGEQFVYTYDVRGNLETASNSTGTITFIYDANDFVQRVDYPAGRFLEYTYDAAGRRKSMTDQTGHQVNYDYDLVGRLQRLSDAAGGLIVRYEYDPAGRLSRETKGNGTYTTYEYDAAWQVVYLVNYGPDDSVQSRFDYTYDAAGRRDSMTTLDRQWTYGYDATDQLVRAVFVSTNSAISNQDLAYQYDLAGNRISVTRNGVVETYATNSMNQYETVGAATYMYDDDGNLISKIDGQDSWTYVYDAENRLAQVVTPQGTWGYEYDALGNRVATVNEGQRTEYLLDLFGLVDVVSQYDGSGMPLAHYDHALGLARQLGPAGDAAYYSFDVLGSTSELTDGTGGVANTYVYDPFGRVLDQDNVFANPFLFVGAWGVMTESNGLEYMRARYYDAELGRFIAEDPIGLSSGDFNFYRYVVNDSVHSIDPSGTSPPPPDPLGIVEPLKCKIHPKSCLPKSEPRKKHDLPHNLPCCPGEVAVLNGKKGPAQHLVCVAPTKREPPAGKTPKIDCKKRTGEQEGESGPMCGGPPSPSGSVTSVDPNEKTGLSGFGEAGYVRPDQTLVYRIDFENYSTATAPAQVVFISDQLSDDLDWATFELTEVGFGEEVIHVPVGLQYFETIVPIVSTSGQAVEVHIQAGLRSDTGLFYALFETIDPVNELPPDVLTGFLPPEDGTGRGVGYVNFLIKAQPDLPSGTEIRNIADITFDYAETIATNQVDPHDPGKGTDPTKEALTTIDAGHPTSTVLPLPVISLPVISLPGFTVEWTGTDDENGSGIAAYDIYVSENNGPFTLWLAGIPTTSFVYPGQTGHSYAFFSVATDNVGHREPEPAQADTQTFVSENLWQNPVDHHDVDGLSGVTPLDVLILINRINAHPGDPSLPTAPETPPPFYDVNGDGVCDPGDVLIVINHLNNQLLGASAGQRTAEPDGAALVDDGIGAVAAARPAYAVMRWGTEDAEMLWASRDDGFVRTPVGRRASGDYQDAVDTLFLRGTGAWRRLDLERIERATDARHRTMRAGGRDGRSNNASPIDLALDGVLEELVDIEPLVGTVVNLGER
jgi:RHS repeat-associated protein